MSKKKEKADSIHISDIHSSSVNVSGGDINNVTTIHSGSGDITLGDKITTIDKAFSGLYRELNKMPDGVDKEDTEDTLRKLENEARKGNHADQNRVSRWLNFLAEISPDVWQVAVQTFINPIAGVSLVFQKVAQRASKSSR
jgi:hypothetical protein